MYITSRITKDLSISTASLRSLVNTLGAVHSPQIFYHLKVTSYIAALGENESLSLKMLSFKVVMLLALTRPSRSNDLSNCLKAMRVLPKGIHFNLVCLAKQSHPSRPLKPFTFPSFSSDKKLCPEEAVLAYISRTEFFRGEGKIGFFFHMLNLTIQHRLLQWPDG